MGLVLVKVAVVPIPTIWYVCINVCIYVDMYVFMTYGCTKVNGIFFSDARFLILSKKLNYFYFLNF